MQFLFVFLDITKIADLRWENADLTRTQEVCHVIIYFLDSLVR